MPVCIIKVKGGRVHLFMNINEFTNNCCIKNTSIIEIIFTLYIPRWDIHNIKVKLELALLQQSEYSALSYMKLCNTFLAHPSYRMIPFSEYGIFIFLFRLVQSLLLNCNSYLKIYCNIILGLPHIIFNPCENPKFPLNKCEGSKSTTVDMGSIHFCCLIIKSCKVSISFSFNL